ncbi:MAG TPA: DUF4270 family protein, partial [Flavobacterium sp.]|nr:DUF4270 family protein [Flavobacterium sp.]
DANLANNNVFKNYFRGLYFKVEEVSGNALAMLDFSKGTIIMTYDDDNVTTVNGVSTTTVVSKTLVLRLAGNRASLLNHVATPESQGYESLADAGKVYIKGGSGAVAFIDLFNGGDPNELNNLRSQAIAGKWLVNEANLVFYVDRNEMLNTIDPNRLYLYDARNYRPVLDYFADQSSNSAKPKYGKFLHDGIVKLSGSSGDAGRKGIKYKIRITEHIKNLIFKDSTNVRLGLSVTETIGNVGNVSLKNPAPQFKKVPAASVMSPLGTVLFGNTPAVPDGKKLRLEIVFTKPAN